MTKKVAISTWCTDDYASVLSVDRLTRSIKHFHPEIDHIVVDSRKTAEIKSQFPWLDFIWMMPPTCMPYADDYDMIIHIDADSVVVGPLTELIESDEDVIGVRNNNSMDRAGANNGITIPHIQPWGNGQEIPVQGFINAGLVGINRKEFLFDWHYLNQKAATGGRPPYLGDENDTLNQLFHSDKYSSKIIDTIGSGVSYGISNLWGSNGNHWESWSSLYVDNGLCMHDPVTAQQMKVKVLHQAGGAVASQINHSVGFYNWLLSIVSDETRNYILDVTSP